MPYYKTCPNCGANLDPSELCDCAKQEVATTIEDDPGPALQISETLLLGIDISNRKDVSCITVGRVKGKNIEILNTIFGEDAEKTYDILMNRGGVIKDY